MNAPDLKIRLRAGLVHLFLSLLVASSAAALIFLVWYPPPLATAQGVGRIVLVLIGVDVAIGPLITVLIFNRTKKSLPFDLTVVGTLQFAALLYGLHAIFIARPAIIAFNIDRFDVVAAVDVDESSLAKAKTAGKPALPLGRPRVVYAKRPEDRKSRQAIMFSAMVGGPDLAQLAEWYEPYAIGRDAVRARVRPLRELRDTNKLDDGAWADFVAALGRSETTVGYLPMRARTRDGAVIVDRETAEILQISLLEPRWE